MSNVIEMKGAREAPRSQRSSMETLIIDIDQIQSWELPGFQRPKTVNDKVEKMAGELKADPVLPGVLTLGRLGKSNTLYIVDGQHRLEAFKMSGLHEVIVDVRIVHFDTMADMSEEYVRLNSAMVRMKPDDIMRGLEALVPHIQKIRAECGYIGYDKVRRGNATSPMVSMSLLIRCWGGSAAETPVGHLSGRTAAAYVRSEMDELSTSQLIKFLHLAYEAWGRDPEYYKLWGSLNLCMCMWLYRRLVLDRTPRGLKRYVMLSETQFRQCLMALSADTRYLDWLQGRYVGERDRSPCYGYVRRLFATRLEQNGLEKAQMPGPAWYSGRGPGRQIARGH